MLSLKVVDVREYIDTAGRSPFTKWLHSLNVQAAAKVATALERIADGNLSNVKPAGQGVLEYKIDFGPGYRIYFGREGDRLVILLAGGTKKRQQGDIRHAKANWEDYRKRKTQGERQHGTDQGFS
jgi:putative addiction module killer protein